MILVDARDGADAVWGEEFLLVQDVAEDTGEAIARRDGEEALDAVTKDIGGFDHNADALRLVTRLEHRYADFDGLNLTWETLEGIVKHNGPLVNEPPGPITSFDKRWPLDLAGWPSLEAQLADAYFSLRGLDAQQKLLQETTAAYGHALQLTEYQHAGGEVSGLDVSQAQAQYQAAEAQLQDAIASRALYLHEIASLIGVPAPSFVLAASPNLPLPPPVPVATPSDLLQRRPDIASAERQVAAANAGIGVTRAAFFPSISLGASGGWQAHGGGVNLFDVKNTLWSLGPGLALTLFEGGYRRAANRIAIDQFDAATENYRSVVLTAFQQVEDNLVLCNRLAAEAAREDLAVQAAVQSTNLSMALYQGGAVTYLNVVSAETSQLLAQQTALSIGTRRLQASVNLIQALGGGWTPATPLPPAMAAAANPAAKS